MLDRTAANEMVCARGKMGANRKVILFFCTRPANSAKIQQKQTGSQIRVRVEQTIMNSFG